VVEILAQPAPSNFRVTIGVALIAAVAALVGAAIAAITAGRRQKRELAHDRELADVSELRAVLDEAAGNIAHAGRAMRQAREAQAEGRSLSDEVENDLKNTQDAMSGSAQRIRIRLGRGALLTAYEKALDAQLEFRNLALGEAGEGEDGDKRLDTSCTEFNQGQDEFFDAAHHIVRSQAGPTSDTRQAESSSGT
jgi:hypothetical protein